MYSHEKSLNQILLKRRDAVMLNPHLMREADEYKAALVATLGKNIEPLGYRLSQDLVKDLMAQPVQEIVDIGKVVEETLKSRLGADVEYHPLYPNFPESVMERSDAELYIDALIYAFSDFTILPFDPPREVEIKTEAKRLTALKTINLGSRNDIKEIAKNLLSSQVAFSPEDKEDLLEIGRDTKRIRSMIPDKIPNKENLVWLASEYMEHVSKEENPFLERFSSAKDLLRFMVVRGGGDASLAEIPKLRRVSRTEAHTCAKLFASMPNAERDLYADRQLFKYVANINHFRNFKEPEIQKMLDRVYNKTMDRSRRSELAAYEKNGDFGRLIHAYQDTPGQMGVDIVKLARLALAQDRRERALAELHAGLAAAAEKMSTLNLLKADAALKASEDERKFNVYAPKKGLSNPYMKPELRDPLPKNVTGLLEGILESELSERYKIKRGLGKVYIEEGLKDIKIPSQQRSNSKQSTGLAYGSQFDIGKDITRLRPFIWWTNSEKNVPIDIDLTATVYDGEMKNLCDVGYYNLVGTANQFGRRQAGDKVFAVHSGDVRNGGKKGGKGAAEFIDFDLKAVKEVFPQAAYVMFTVNVYAGISFADTPCKFGWMKDVEESSLRLDAAQRRSGSAMFYGDSERNAPAFDVTKAERVIEINTDSSRAIPVIFDIDNQKMIWMDRNPKLFSDFAVRYPDTYHGVNNNICNMNCLMTEAYRATHLIAPDLYTLMEAHINARAEGVVSDPKEADTLFTVERVDPADYPNAKNFICAYDNDMILGDLLPDELSEKDIEYFRELEETEKEEPEKDSVTVNDAER